MMPAISQCPVVVSLPFDCKAHLPNDARGCETGATPFRGRMFPRPQLCRFGSCTGRESQICPSVSEPASPHSAASGISPMPRPSRTIIVIRLNEVLVGMLEERFLICYFAGVRAVFKIRGKGKAQLTL